MKSPLSILIAAIALAALIAAAPPAKADNGRIMLAQMGGPRDKDKDKDKSDADKKADKKKQDDKKRMGGGNHDQKNKQKAQPQQQNQQRQHDDDAARKQRENDAAQRKQRDDAAKRKQHDDAAQRKQRDDAARRKQPDKEPPKTLAAPAPPSQPQDSKEFIRRAGDKPSGGLNEVRKQRQRSKEGNREVIREGDRTIERERNRAIIRHDEAKRFAVGARRVNVEHRGGDTFTIVLRPDGIRIVNVTDRNGHLVRRLRRDARGRDVVIFDSGAVDPRHRGDLFVNVRPPRFRDRHHRRYVDAGRSDFALIFDFLTADPFERPDRFYTVDQVRYSYPLRTYMPRVDLDVNFDSGSWQLTPDQIGHLSVIARALNRAIDRNPRELFLIEGHTDAVGSWEDNLSLSDRRAETVAVVLTEEFGVPPENLITQGYGEEHLKAPTPGPSRENRRVAVRRITPLVAQGPSGARR